MNELLEELARGLANAAKKPNILSYKPNSPIHLKFHESDRIGRILRGGNRSGKTVAGAVEGIWRATGRHPYQKTHELPTRGRIVTVDRDAGMKQIILPVLKQWIPPSELVNGSWEDSWSNSDKVLRFRNGSEIEIKTHQQDIDSFAGVPRHWVWFDEECPQGIFQECRLRLIDYNGVWFMTMTPVEGQDWIFDRFIVTANKNVEMFEVDISDNPHLNKQALEMLEEDLTEDEKLVRQKGVFVPRGGLILREFNYSKHVIDTPNVIPRNWSFYVSIDHGFNNPTAILWHAVSPQGDVVTFMEHYKNRMLIKDHAARIKQINAEYGISPTLYMCDPSMSQKNAETGNSPIQVYRMNGIPVVPAKKDVAGGIDKMNEYFKYDKWHITKNCVNTIKEFKGYSFKIFTSPKIADRNNVREEPNKKNDHTPDSSRYFFSFMPFIGPEVKNERKTASLTETRPQEFPWEIDSNLMSGLDDYDDLSFGEIR